MSWLFSWFPPSDDHSLMTLIRPIKFGNDKSKAPASIFLAGAWLLSNLYLDSTFAASESRPFIRDSRRDGRLNNRR
jgi:hypothetical protein